MPREKEIIVLRYGLKGYQPRTQREVAKYLGISRSYVSRIEKKALEKMKDAFVMDLSFLGWLLLGVVTLNLGNIFWTNPYMNATDAALYQELTGRA